MKSLFKIALVSIVLLACSPKLAKTSVNSSTPTQADADRAAAKWEGTTLENLNSGKTLYEANCGKCHALPAISSRNEEGWNKIVPPMAQKARLSSESENYILKYVVTMTTKK